MSETFTSKFARELGELGEPSNDVGDTLQMTMRADGLTKGQVARVLYYCEEEKHSEGWHMIAQECAELVYIITGKR